ncbi:MAG TPA: NAD(P)/FAD-dependent oxidoreductase [Flavisolibacter sp.]|nr:NAD(P)/FAD-dependent oxidoreductase [Flavisolibacter sp.]
MTKEPIRIVIVGGGFAGINLARELAHNTNFFITLVDRNNYNFFPPLLYQVSTSFLEASNISYPFRKLFQKRKNISFRMGEFLKVVPGENKIVLSTIELIYDHLVFATGTETNYFGIENVKKYALPMKTVNDALELRNSILQKLEKATVTTDPAERKKLLTVVVAGGGPTGVEISGMLAEMRRNIFWKDYPELQGLESNIYLVDAGEKVLAPMSEKSQNYTYEALVSLGVNVRMHMQVKDFSNDKVVFATGETIETKTLIWAAGVTASVLEGIPADKFGKGKRLLVDEFNKVMGMNNIYAIGDTCLQTADKNFPAGHPQVAQVAIQHGKRLADNFIRLSEQQQLIPFTYKDKGTMAIIGRNKAVADLPKPKLHFNGFIAFFMWIFIHLISLINYRNRIKTLYNWMGAYLTKDQSLRMIIRPGKSENK